LRIVFKIKLVILAGKLGIQGSIVRLFGEVMVLAEEIEGQ